MKVAYQNGPDIAHSLSQIANSWYSTLRSVHFSVSADRSVQLDGILEAGTKTDGTTVLSLPRNLRPSRTRSFDTVCRRSSDGARSTALLEITTGGDLKVYGMPADHNYLYLDPVRFEAA